MGIEHRLRQGKELTAAGRMDFAPAPLAIIERLARICSRGRNAPRPLLAITAGYKTRAAPTYYSGLEELPKLLLCYYFECGRNFLLRWSSCMRQDQRAPRHAGH